MTNVGVPADTQCHHAYHKCPRSKCNQMTMPRPITVITKSQVELQTNQPREESDEARRRGDPPSETVENQTRVAARKTGDDGGKKGPMEVEVEAPATQSANPNPSVTTNRPPRGPACRTCLSSRRTYGSSRRQPEAASPHGYCPPLHHSPLELVPRQKHRMRLHHHHATRAGSSQRGARSTHRESPP